MRPPQVTLRSDKAKDTRDRIIREATQLISVKGFFHTTVDDVLARVQLTKGGFYAHFDSKESLGRAVIEHATQLWVERVITYAMQFADPAAQLHGLLEAYRLYAVERTFEGGCFFINLAIEMDDQHDEFADLVADRFAQFRGLIVNIAEMGKASGSLAADTPSEGLAVAIVSYLTGTMMQSKVSKTFSHFEKGNQVMQRLIAQYETRRSTHV